MSLILFAVIGISIPASESSAAVNIVCTSGNAFYIDASANLLARYVSYQITNTDPLVYNDVWVEIGNFTGGVVSLAPNETNLYHLGLLPVGTTKTAFFYIQAGNVTSIPQSHAVSVYDGQPPSGAIVSNAMFSFSSVGASISAGSSKITTISWSPVPPVLGGLLSITVDGECGIIGNNGLMIFSPAGFPDWPASSYRLVSTEVMLGGGINTVLRDRLFHSGSSQRNVTYHAVYTFRMVGIPPGPSIASPVATISSGSRMKHDNVSIFDVINPIYPAANLVLLRKSVMPPNIRGADTATYSITLANLGASSVQVDSINDILPSMPAAPSYLIGSSRFNSVPVLDPRISGTQLKWTGPYVVDSGEIATLAFDAAFPAMEGRYTNLAFAAVGNIRIDSTLDVTDYAPASATIVVGMPNIMMLKSAQVLSDPINGNSNPKAIPGARLLYTITITNRGVGGADDHSVFAGDLISVGASLFVGDISGGGPVVFEDGIPSCGMNYSYAGLSSITDDVSFSDDSGATYTYIPVPDSTGYDSRVTNVSVNPKGIFQGAIGNSYPNVTIKFLVRLR